MKIRNLIIAGLLGIFVMSCAGCNNLTEDDKPEELWRYLGTSTANVGGENINYHLYWAKDDRDEIVYKITNDFREKTGCNLISVAAVYAPNNLNISPNVTSMMKNKNANVSITYDFQYVIVNVIYDDGYIKTEVYNR